MTDYDAAAHISEEVHRAAIAAPVAIFVAVIGTGVSVVSALRSVLPPPNPES
jgi:hypothetical protein